MNNYKLQKIDYKNTICPVCGEKLTGLLREDYKLIHSCGFVLDEGYPYTGGFLVNYSADFKIRHIK